MSDRGSGLEDLGTCPNCATVVVYRGVGRRPIWCSTRCRNDAALRRLGARRGAIEVRVVEVPRLRGEDVSKPEASSSDPLATADGGERKAATPSADQALRLIRNDPESVGKLLAHLERRRSDGTLSDPEWLPVRNALRLITRELTSVVERP